MRLMNMARGLTTEFRRSPISAIADTLSVVAVIGSASGAALGVAMPDSGGGAALGGLIVALTDAALPVKLAVVALLSCALGWAAATVSDRLARMQSDLSGPLGWVATLCASAILVWITQIFSEMQSHAFLPQSNLMLVVGLGIALCLMRKRFESAGRLTNPSHAQERSMTILVFGGGTLAIATLAELAVL